MRVRNGFARWFGGRPWSADHRALRPAGLGWALIVLAALVGSCGDAERADRDICFVNQDCDSGYRCEGGVCVPDSTSTCLKSEDCEPGHDCRGGVCVPALAACVEDEDCGENEWCRQASDGPVCECKEGYHRSDDECISNTRTVPCENTKLDDSSWSEGYSDGHLTQPWDGTAFVPPADTCEWECNPSYHEHETGEAVLCVECLDESHCEEPTAHCSTVTNMCVECEFDEHCGEGSICLSDLCHENPRVFECTPQLSEGAEWNSVSEYVQEWNPLTERWEPQDSEIHYNEMPDDSSCRYVCSEGYRFNGRACEPRPVCGSGDKLDTFFNRSVTAEDLLAAMDICDFYEPGVQGSWGILADSARLVKANWPTDTGRPDWRQYGVKTRFGTNSSNRPTFGGNFAVLSSGHARDADDFNATSQPSYSHGLSMFDRPPKDFVDAHGGRLPVTREGCPSGQFANDSVNLRVEIKVPPFANAFSFDFRFFSQEYLEFTCSEFNDFFITMLDTSWTPGAGEDPIPADKNISFDSAGNYISVNSDQFFTVCRPKTCVNSDLVYDCPDGTAALSGTGYEPANAGATHWLTTTAPVVPGETITLRFIIWDTTDTLYDSLVLLDNFRWHARQGAGPITGPVAP